MAPLPVCSSAELCRAGADGASKNCWNAGVGSIDVHHSSIIANHFFSQLAEGSNPASLPASPTCTSPTVTAIGRNKAKANP